MNNLIEYDDFIIGCKNDLIKYIEEQSKRLRKDETVSNDWLAHYLTENENIIEELEKHSNFELLGIGEGIMGDLTIKEVNIEME